MSLILSHLPVRMDIMKTTEYNELVAHLEEASKAYYSGSDEVMSDADFDSGMRLATEYEVENGIADGIATRVGAGYTPVGSTVKHEVPMLSLSNEYTAEDSKTWAERREADAGFTTLWSCEPKLDGSAISIRYKNGKPTEMITRGDGIKGENISHNVDLIVLPTNTVGDFTVRGEVLMTEDQFADANEKREAARGTGFANPRNATAGILGTDSDKRTLHGVELSFVAYDALGLEGTTSVEITEQLEAMGFQTTLGMGEVCSTEELIATLQKMEEARMSYPYELDGIVVKAVDFNFRDELGTGSKAPKYAHALKFPNSTSEGIVTDVIVNVGKTGKISFKAEIDNTELNGEGVSLEGTSIRYATLHTVGFISDENIKIGSKVSVERAAGVIPRIVNGQDPEGTTLPAYVPPTECPKCNETLEIDGEHLFCRSSECALGKWIEYTVGRDIFDCDGVGSSFVEKALETYPHIEDLADFYALTEEQVHAVEGYENRAGDIAYEAMQTAKNANLSRFVSSLAISGTGRSMGKRIAAHFRSIEAVLNGTVDDFVEIEGIAKKKAEKIVPALVKLAPMVQRMLDMGFTAIHDAPVAVEQTSENILTGKKVYVTGAIWLKKAEAQAAIEAMGGIFKSASKLDFIIAAEENAKVMKLVEKGATFMSEDEFRSLVESAS